MAIGNAAWPIGMQSTFFGIGFRSVLVLVVLISVLVLIRS
jgi:hypothetical protein